jgi:hypothetical protein
MHSLIPIAHAGVLKDAPSLAQVFLNAFLFLLEIAGILMTISLCVAGLIMLFAAGDQKIYTKAKKALTYSLVGTLVILGCSVIIHFLVKALTIDL